MADQPIVHSCRLPMLNGERLVREIAERHGVTYASIRGRSRGRYSSMPLFAARIEAARALHDILGFNGPKIARLLRKDHTTIYFYLGRVARRKPRGRADGEEAG